jgi:hypothetical protein
MEGNALGPRPRVLTKPARWNKLGVKGNKQKRRSTGKRAWKGQSCGCGAVAALLVLTFAQKGAEEPADPSFLMDVQTRGIDVQYIDMV